MEQSFIPPHNINFNRYLSFSRKQKREPTEQYYSVLNELAEKCFFEHCEETEKRDVIIIDISDTEIQRHLLCEITYPSVALKTDLNMEV